ncbi:MAG: TrkH family potassium uptake protein [Bacillota bacterium]|nr:TrkH family potassium uptake protein [Bacillota bacterium]
MLEKIRSISLNPPLVLTLGFALIIFIGACLLSLGIFTRSGQSIGFLNALFTAASATCVTGLVVVNTLEYWNLAGQILILTLIQIGGLGIMTLATLFPLVMRKRIGLTSRQIIREQLNVESFSGLVKLLRYVLYFSLAVEAIGALFLAIVFVPDFGLKLGLWRSIFHSVSAFCNAGFDIMGNSMVDYRSDIIVNFTIMTLVIVGGLGFGVNAEIFSKKKRKSFSTHGKLVLTTSLVLTVLGALVFFVIEYNNIYSLGSENLGTKSLVSLFQSVVARTAGFNSLNLGAIRDSSAVLMLMLMFVGGSPGSTAGGLKTTTFGVLFAATISVIRGEESVRIFRKKVPTETVLKSLALVIISIVIVVGFSFLLSLTEDFAYIDILYEVVSAYATVGVTRGLTGDLSNFGKLLIILTMYMGRIGPLTMAFAFGKKQKKSKLEYPDANIAVG